MKDTFNKTIITNQHLRWNSIQIPFRRLLSHDSIHRPKIPPILRKSPQNSNSDAEILATIVDFDHNELKKKQNLTKRAIEKISYGGNPWGSHWWCMKNLKKLNKQNSEGLDGSWDEKADQHTSSQHQPTPTPIRRHILILVSIWNNIIHRLARSTYIKTSNVIPLLSLLCTAD